MLLSDELTVIDFPDRTGNIKTAKSKTVMRKHFIIHIIYGLSFIFTGLIYAKEYIVRCTVTDYSDNVIPNAPFYIQDSIENRFYGSTDSTGQLTITVETEDSEEDRGENDAERDDLSGLTYQLISDDGTITVYNVLGQMVYEQKLQPGIHELQMKDDLPSGKYFVVMKTQTYTAVSSFTMIHDELIGIGKTEIKRDLSSTYHSFNGSMVIQCALHGSKQGYEQVNIDFELGQQYCDYDEIIRMNRIPSQSFGMADTLWPGIDLNHFICNDDKGTWNNHSGQIHIIDGVITLDGSQQSGYDDFLFTYQDSINSNLCLEFNKKIQLHQNQKTALLLVIENVNIIGDDRLELGFLLFHNTAIKLLAEFFQVNESDLRNMSLNEIVDVYGEPWQIDEMIHIASSFYQKVVVLTDSMATFSNFVDSLIDLSNDHYTIDTIFNLHGGINCVCFYDATVFIEEMISCLNQHGLKIRTLYQTCCYGSSMIHDWENMGMYAVNGAKSLNHFSIFSPIYFLHYWTTGLNFKDAVERAYQSEMDQWISYNTTLPVINYLLTEDTLDESRQFVGGWKENCFWLHNN